VSFYTLTAIATLACEPSITAKAERVRLARHAYAATSLSDRCSLFYCFASENVEHRRHAARTQHLAVAKSACSAVHLHRPVSRALDDSRNVSDMSTIAQFDEFQCRRHFQADKPNIGDG
jgi:hypothetical protein